MTSRVNLRRRRLIKAGLAGGAATLAAGALYTRIGSIFGNKVPAYMPLDGHNAHLRTGTSAQPYTRPEGQMDPMVFLRSFDYGKTTLLPSGRTLREYFIYAEDRVIEVAPGVKYPGWIFNGQVPAPTLRCTEGDLVRVHFENRGEHPHTIHFHGFHPANMDGVFEVIQKGGSYTYEFEAEPFGLHLYHCHVMPLKKHISKGLYGTFIIDPKTPRPPADEMVMVMNGFDVNFDNGNEFYTVNGIANYYLDNPIEIKMNQLIRIYLVNVTEFDLINSIHTHATFFRFYRTGTRLDQYEYTDTVMLCQGERGIMELTYKFPGLFMFHAHQSEFAELGWMGLFKVT